MAIRAPYVAPCDLTLQSGPRDMIDQLRDRSALHRRIAMIEFEDDGIAFAAIDAVMSRKVVVDLLTALLAVELPLLRPAR